MITIFDLIQTRGELCEVCGLDKATDAHHCIEMRQKRYMKELTVAENLEAVCHKCHMEGRADSAEHAIEFAKRQVERGYDILRWYNSLPMKTKRFPNLKAMLEDK